jgi:D-alanyl-D-alanine carboxypeptidase/D-alanyl-D-alanine-endopeptidase (penicillin-binding protein 4)
MVSRRRFLIGAQSALLAAGAGRAYGEAPETSLFPQPRSTDLIRRSIAPLADVIADAALPGRVGCAVADAGTGEMLEVFNALYPMPPASVAKAVTTAYGLDRLGPGYRFRTTLVTDGAVTDGRLDGDLWLVGGGDPVLDTDALDDMARALAETGIREDRWRVPDRHRCACPPSTRSTPRNCPMWATTPRSRRSTSISTACSSNGSATGEGYTVRMDARSDNHSPMVTVSRMTIEPRDYPVYTFDRTEARDEWTVARSALGNGGGRWLPVRRPPAYLAEVFQMQARSPGARAGHAGGFGKRTARARILVEHASPPLEDILRGMMRWSTNLTAEVVGLSATQAGGVRPDDPGRERGRNGGMDARPLGARQARFVDHSGLGVASRSASHDMTRALVAAGPDGLLRGLMRDIPVLDDDGKPPDPR